MSCLSTTSCVCPPYGRLHSLLFLHVCLSAPHSYMSIVESLPTYGVHYYAVKVQFYYSAFSFHTHTHTLAHIFVRFGLVSRKLAILHTQKTICISSVFQSRAQASLTPFCVCVFQDKQGIPWWLGLSYKGIFQYDHQDKVKPRKVRQRFFETSVTYKTSKGCPLLTSMILFTCMMQYQRKVLFLYLFFCL